MSREFRGNDGGDVFYVGLKDPIPEDLNGIQHPLPANVVPFTSLEEKARREVLRATAADLASVAERLKEAAAKLGASGVRLRSVPGKPQHPMIRVLFTLRGHIVKAARKLLDRSER